MDDFRKPKSIAVIAVVMFTWTSGLPATGGNPVSHQNSPPTEHPMVRIAKHRLDRTGRFLGYGWGDGYHACHGSGFRPGADLPARSSHATRGHKVLFGNTFYDRFDNQNLIYPQDHYELYSVAPKPNKRSTSVAHLRNVDGNSRWNVSEAFPLDEILYSAVTSSAVTSSAVTSSAVTSEPPNSAPSILERPVIARPVVDYRAIAVANVPNAEVPQQLPPLKRSYSEVEPALPAAEDSAAQQRSSKPSRMPAISQKPSRVAQIGPQPIRIEPTIVDSSTSPPVPPSPSRIAETSKVLIDAAKTIQQNPFVR